MRDEEKSNPSLGISLPNSLSLISLPIIFVLIILSFSNQGRGQELLLSAAGVFWLIFSLGRGNPVKTSFTGLSILYVIIALLSLFNEFKAAEGLAVVSLPFLTMSFGLFFYAVYKESRQE